MTDLFISTKKGKFDDVIRNIRKKKYVVATANSKMNEIILNLDTLKPRSDEFKKIKTIVAKMRGVESVEIIKSYLKAKNTSLEESLSRNRCRLILDVDSTITRGGIGIIESSIPTLLQSIEDKGIWIYIATGRSVYDLIQMVQNIPVQKTSIAENGGIILGFATDGYIEVGNKTEPNKILRYLQEKYQVKEDMRQGERITEVILLQSEVTAAQIKKAEKTTKAKISIHQSQNSFHISKSGVDKGTAITELARRLKWGNAFKIAVGDSQMDVAMFNACDYSFAPKNADDSAKEACTEVLDANYEKAITILHDRFLKTN